MARIIIGLIVVALGAIIVLKSEWLYQNVGAIGWAEQHLHTEGGSRLIYKLIGIIGIIIGFLITTNLISKVLLFIFGKLFSGFTL